MVAGPLEHVKPGRRLNWRFDPNLPVVQISWFGTVRDDSELLHEGAVQFSHCGPAA